MYWDLLACCYLKTASGLDGKCSSECFFQHQILMWHKPWAILKIILLFVQTLADLFENVENKKFCQKLLWFICIFRDLEC